MSVFDELTGQSAAVAELASAALAAADLVAGRDVFAYFKHEETPEGVLYAVEILKSVAATSL